MRASLVAVMAALTTPVVAATLTPNEIQTTFFTGQPFTASATNVKYKMVFSADGKMLSVMPEATIDNTYKFLSEDTLQVSYQGKAGSKYKVSVTPTDLSLTCDENHDLDVAYKRAK